VVAIAALTGIGHSAHTASRSCLEKWAFCLPAPTEVVQPTARPGGRMHERAAAQPHQRQGHRVLRLGHPLTTGGTTRPGQPPETAAWPRWRQPGTQRTVAIWTAWPGLASIAPAGPKRATVPAPARSPRPSSPTPAPSVSPRHTSHLSAPAAGPSPLGVAAIAAGITLAIVGAVLAYRRFSRK